MNNLKFTLAKVFMKTIGQTNDGIRLCYKEGLTSGKMLDYIYRNQPNGRLLIGKSIDRAFLNDPGWEAVRSRRKNLEMLLVESIEKLRKEKRSVQFLESVVKEERRSFSNQLNVALEEWIRVKNELHPQLIKEIKEALKSRKPQPVWKG